MASSAKRRIRVVAAAAERDGKFLITQRQATSSLPLLWEFPGGRVKEDRGHVTHDMSNIADLSALQRVLLMRIGASANVVHIGKPLKKHTHEYADYIVDMIIYMVTLADDFIPEARAVAQVEWVSLEAMRHYTFAPADQHSMDLILFDESGELH